MGKEPYPNILQSFGIVGIFILASLVFSTVFILKQIFNLNSEFIMMVYYLLTAGGTFLIVRFFKRKIEGSLKINFSTEDNGSYFLMALAAVALLFVSGSVASLIPMPDTLKLIIAKMAEQKGIFTFIYFVFLAPIFEELIFRGVMLDGLLKRYSPQKSIIISSLLFGLTHLNPWQFVVALFIGYFSGWVYYRAKSVLPCIIIHAAANGTSFLMRHFLSSEDFHNSSPILLGDIMHLGYVIMALALLLISVYLLNELLPEGEKHFHKSTVINPNLDG